MNKEETVQKADVCCDKPCCSRKKISVDFFGAFLFISLGTILLLNNFGFLPWTIWETLLRFWPALLIILGVQIFFGRGLVGGIITSLVGIVILAVVLAFSLAMVNPQFSSYLEWKYPKWNEIKKQIPEQKTELNLQTKRKVFKCDSNGSCQMYYR